MASPPADLTGGAAPRGQPSPAPAADGVIVVDKPAGPTSHDVVAWVRRILRQRRVGHLGTLDPAATGVLPMVLGRATRLARFLSGSVKTYEASILLGRATDTHDATGRDLAPASVDAETALAGLTVERIDEALERFRGRHLQTPPAFSAKHVAGERAHVRARRNEDVQPTPVEVTTYSLDRLDFHSPVLRVRLEVSAGFYVRAFAHALGLALGCGACLGALRRTRAGEFDLTRAVPLDGPLPRYAAPLRAGLIPLDAMLAQLPGLRLTAGGLERARHGQPIRAEDDAISLPAEAARPTGSGGLEAAGHRDRFVRLISGTGALVAIAERTPGGTLHPIVVVG